MVADWGTCQPVWVRIPHSVATAAAAVRYMPDLRLKRKNRKFLPIAAFLSVVPRATRSAYTGGVAPQKQCRSVFFLRLGLFSLTMRSLKRKAPLANLKALGFLPRWLSTRCLLAPPPL